MGSAVILEKMVTQIEVDGFHGILAGALTRHGAGGLRME